METRDDNVGVEISTNRKSLLRSLFLDFFFFRVRVPPEVRREVSPSKSREGARGKSRAARSIERAAGTRRAVIRDSEVLRAWHCSCTKCGEGIHGVFS